MILRQLSTRTLAMVLYIASSLLTPALGATAVAQPKAAQKESIAQLMGQADAAYNAADFQRALQIYTYSQRKFPADTSAIVGSARALIGLARIEEAKSQCLKAIALKDVSDVPHRILGDIYQAEGKNNDALKEYQKAAAFKNAHIETHLSLADFYGVSGEFEKANDEYEKVLEIDSNNTHARLNCAGYLASKGKISQAAAYCTGNIPLCPDARPPDNPSVMMEVGKLYLSKDRTLALDFLKRARKRRVDDPMTYIMLAFVSGMGNDWASVRQYAQDFLDVDPDNNNALQMVAWSYYATEDTREAKSQLEHLLTILPNSAEVHNLYGLVLADLRRFKDAQQEFNKAKELSTDPQVPLMNLCMLHVIAGDPGKAVSEVEGLMKRYPTNSVRALAAYAYVSNGRAKDAESLAAQVLRDEPQNVLACVAMARTQVINGQSQVALATLETCLKNNANTAFLNCELSQACLSADKFKDAAEYAQAALQLAPANPTAKRYFATALSKQGNFDGAALFLKELSGRESGDIQLKLLLADILERAGRTDEAAKAYRAALKLDAQSAEAQAGLARLTKAQGGR